MLCLAHQPSLGSQAYLAIRLDPLAAPREPAPVLCDVHPNSVRRADADLQLERGPVFQRELVPSAPAGAAAPPIFQVAAVPGVQGMGMLLSRQLSSVAFYPTTLEANHDAMVISCQFHPAYAVI